MIHSSATKDGRTQKISDIGGVRDIKILVFIAHAIGYPLAVAAPIFIDPLLKSHVVYSTRHYPYAFLCVVIYLLLLLVQLVLFYKSSSLKVLYFSICAFALAITLSFPIFLPELPHGNVLAVGLTTSFLSAFAIFVWSIGEKIFLDQKVLKAAGNATFDYMKVLFTFVRQGAFAGVTLFGALFLTAFATASKYTDATVTDKSDMFLLNVNMIFQLSFYGLYSIIGPIRYFFLMNLKLLDQFKDIAKRLDRQDKKAYDTESRLKRSHQPGRRSEAS